MIRNAGERRDSRTLGIHVRKDDDRVTIAPTAAGLRPSVCETNWKAARQGHRPGKVRMADLSERAGRQAKGRGEGSA